MISDEMLAHVFDRWRTAGELDVLLQFLREMEDTTLLGVQAQWHSTVAADGRGLALLSYRQGTLAGIRRVRIVLEAMARKEPVPAPVDEFGA